MFSKLNRVPRSKAKQDELEKWLDNRLSLSSDDYTIRDKWLIYKLGREPDRCTCGKTVHIDDSTGNTFKKYCSIECARLYGTGNRGQGQRLPVSHDEFVDICVKHNFKVQRVAKEFTTSFPVANRWFKECGIFEIKAERDKQWKEFIEANNTLTINELAKHLNTTPTIIRLFIRSNNIELVDTRLETREYNISTLEQHKHLFNDHTLQEISEITGIHYEWVKAFRKRYDFAYVIKSKPYSKTEKELLSFIQQFHHTAGPRKYNFDGKVYEADIMIPELNLAIEFNGVYWHDSFKIDKNYHQVKSNAFATKQIQLIHIWENDWNHKREIVESVVLSKLGKSERIYARKCTIVEVSKNIADEFFNITHLKGAGKSGITYGLMHDNELVMCMRFARHKKHEWELLRMSSMLGITVVGGMSKLLKHFTHTHNAQSIMSYVDRDISNGSSYYRNGFTLLSTTEPSYWYVDKNGLVLQRQQFQRHKINANESEYTQKLGLIRIHNSGNLKMLLIV